MVGTAAIDPSTGVITFVNDDVVDENEETEIYFSAVFCVHGNNRNDIILKVVQMLNDGGVHCAFVRPENAHVHV